MKVIILIAAVLAIATALPTSTGNNQDTTILRQSNDNIGVGHYNTDFETSDGTSQREHAELKHVDGSETDSIAVRGSYSYVGTDGVTYTVNYVADENGFQPTGKHLQVPAV